MLKNLFLTYFWPTFWISRKPAFWPNLFRGFGASSRLADPQCELQSFKGKSGAVPGPEAFIELNQLYYRVNSLGMELNRSLAYLAVPAAIYRSAQGPRPESAPRSALWAILGTCLGVPQRVLSECFLALFRPKRQKTLKKHSLGHSEAGAGPLGTPVNGGRVPKAYHLFQNVYWPP